MSCDSGVNCVGLQQNDKKNSRHRKHSVPKPSKADHAKQNNLNGHKIEEIVETSDGARKNQVVCEAEINTCVQRTENEYVVMEVVKNDEDSRSNTDSLNLDSLMGTGSELSYDTVVNKGAKKDSNGQDVENVTKETADLVLGDSGFCSPRIVEGQSPSSEKQEIQNRVEQIKKASNSNLCPKNVYQKSDDGSFHSDQELMCNDKENQYKVLNNMKSVPQERSVLTHYNQVQHFTNNSDHVDPKFMHQIPFKFNFWRRLWSRWGCVTVTVLIMYTF